MGSWISQILIKDELTDFNSTQGMPSGDGMDVTIKIVMEWSDGLIGSLCRHGYVSLPSAGKDGRQNFIISITYHQPLLSLTSGLWVSSSPPSSRLSHLDFSWLEQGRFPPILMYCPDCSLYVSWRWAYGIGSMYGLSVLSLIIFFGRET